MEKQEVLKLHEYRGLISKIEFLEGLSETEFNEGMIKFNIPDITRIGQTNNGEGVWGWISPTDKISYENNGFQGEIKAILCNTPLNFFGILFWGTEVVIKCNGSSRPVISYEWVRKNITEKEWYSEAMSKEN